MRLRKRNIQSPSVQFEKHQPERRRGVGSTPNCCCGSCCCCCCLHSLGGLIAAAVATSVRKSRVGGSAAGCYWICLAVLTGALFVLIWSSSSSSGPFAFEAIVASLFLPVVQLAASLLTFIWILILGMDIPDRKSSLQTLGRITLWSFLGAVVGLVAMVALFRNLK